jgi:hypothetical protein
MSLTSILSRRISVLADAAAVSTCRAPTAMTGLAGMDPAAAARAG